MRNDTIPRTAVGTILHLRYATTTSEGAIIGTPSVLSLMPAVEAVRAEAGQWRLKEVDFGQNIESPML